MDKKQQIIEALRTFTRQRSGLEYCNYNDVKSFRSEQRSITTDLHHARELIRSVELHDSITADDIIQASKRAYSGRLTIVERADGAIGIDYCAGQYFPTEYRRAVCAVMASALWDWKRTQCMPEPEIVARPGSDSLTDERYQGLSAGDWLRRSFKREYGRAIAARWFN